MPANGIRHRHDGGGWMGCVPFAVSSCDPERVADKPSSIELSISTGHRGDAKRRPGRTSPSSSSRIRSGIGILSIMIIAAAMSSARAQTPDGVLTLGQALASALQKSPDLAAFSSELRVSEARLLQAGLRPNPAAAMTVEDFAGSGEFDGLGVAQTTLQLSQLIELGGKRSARRDVAASARDLAGSEYELKRIDVLSDVTAKFIAVLATQHGLALADQAIEAAESVFRSAEERLEVGKGTALEGRKATVGLARSRIAQEQASREWQAARYRLAATWGDTTPMFTQVEADLFAVAQPPTFEALAGRIAASPTMARWEAEKRLRLTELELAQSRRTPDLTVGGGVRRFNGPDEYAFVAEVSLPLPLFDRNQGGRDEAQALAEVASLSRLAAESRLRTQLHGLHQELVQAVRAVENIHGEILPQAEETLEIAADGYRQGRFSYLETADAQETLLAVRRDYIEAAKSYHMLVAEIERLTGQPLHP
jgi:cobalt-zinc-cadmium efflux system outer membrane protein